MRFLNDHPGTGIIQHVFEPTMTPAEAIVIDAVYGTRTARQIEQDKYIDRLNVRPISGPLKPGPAPEPDANRVEAFWCDKDRGTDLQELLELVERMEATQAGTFKADGHDAAIRDHAVAGERVIYAAKQVRWAERRAGLAND